MDVPLELAFDGLDHSDWAEAEIRRRVAKLAKRHERLTAVRVRVGLDGRPHRGGNVFAVRIELSVPGPGPDLIVSQEPHRAREKYREPTLRSAIRDAFEAAERQLTGVKRQMNGEGKPAHEVELRGEVSQTFPEADHGFLLSAAGSQLYFTRDAVLRGNFDALAPGDPVYYVETVGDTGPIAKKVRRTEQAD